MKNNEIIDPATVEPQIEATETVETQELTPAQQKAAAILRARLPHLTENALNFEKRTGAFFKASLETVKDEDGNVKLDEKGAPVEKMRRTVVEETELPADAADEIAAKRAAALVAGAEAKREAAAKAVEDAAAALAVAKEKAAALEGEIAAAEAIVDSFVLPEKPARERANVAAIKEKAEKAISEAQRLREMLLAMGIDPDKTDN